MNIPMIILFAAIILLSGCQMSDEEIQLKLIEANSGLDSYSFDMAMDLDLTTDIQEQELKVGTSSKMTGGVDRENKKAAIAGTVKMESMGMRTEMDMEVYVIDDMMYSKTMNIWVKTGLGEGMWEQQDQIAQTLALIESGTLERLEDESIEGNDYYVYKITPDIEKLIDTLLQGEDLSALIGEELDLGDMIKEYSATVWINKDTFVIERSAADMVMLMSPEDVGEEGTGEMRIVASVETTISDIGESMTIELPKEALDALDMSEIQGAFEPDEPAPGNTITGAAIAKAFG